MALYLNCGKNSMSACRAPVPAGAVPAGAARDGRASVPAAVLAGAAQSMGDALIEFFFFFFPIFSVGPQLALW